MTIAQFEHFLQHIDGFVKSAYTNAGIAYDDLEHHKCEKEERNNIEKDMLIKAIIPPIMTDVVKSILTTTINELREQIDEAELYFLNVGWLGFTHDESSKRWRRTHPVDAMKKIELKETAKTKRCIRCGNLTEDTIPYKGVNLAILGLHRSCVCGSLFMVGEDEIDDLSSVGVVR